MFEECEEDHDECGQQVEDEPGDEEGFGVDSSNPPEECEPGECVEGEDVAVPEEVAVDESEDEEPCASGVPEGGAGAEFGVVELGGVIELSCVHDDA